MKNELTIYAQLFSLRKYYMQCQRTVQLVSIRQDDITDGELCVHLLDEECLGNLIEHVSLTQLPVPLDPRQFLSVRGDRADIAIQRNCNNLFSTLVIYMQMYVHVKE